MLRYYVIVSLLAGWAQLYGQQNVPFHRIKNLSIQSTISYCAYKDFSRTMAVTTDYRYSLKKHLNLISSITMANGKRKKGNIAESLTFTSWNTGCEAHLRLRDKFIWNIGSGVSLSSLRTDVVMNTVKLENIDQEIHNIVEWRNCGYFINTGIFYSVGNNVAFGANYTINYLNNAESYLQIVGVSCRITIGK